MSEELAETGKRLAAIAAEPHVTYEELCQIARDIRAKREASWDAAQGRYTLSVARIMEIELKDCIKVQAFRNIIYLMVFNDMEDWT